LYKKLFFYKSEKTAVKYRFFGIFEKILGIQAVVLPVQALIRKSGSVKGGSFSVISVFVMRGRFELGLRKQPKKLGRFGNGQKIVFI